MSATLEFRYNDDNDTVDVLYKGCAPLDQYIRFRLTAPNRTWSKVAQCWVVTPDVLDKIAAMASPHFEEIKYFSLPPHLQKLVRKFITEDFGKKEKKKAKVKPTNETSTSPYATLFLTPGAPKFVIKAVYKAMASHYHPDKKTGNNERFIEIADAYKTITSKMS